MKKIPYGISNYEIIKSENYYFVDKTEFIKKLENLGSRYIFFLRPRRFGKSLFLSILENYYDILKKDKFDILFKETYIGKNPTPLRNSYPVLKFNFSGVSVSDSIKETEKSFDYLIKMDIENFFRRYSKIYPELKEVKDEVFTLDRAGDILNGFIRVLGWLGISYYLLIDEYDNFANNILIGYGKGTYREITHGIGFLRNFFAVIKNGTENRSIDKLFVTGVSPLLLSDVTSGMNIGKNISTLPDFNEMVGFNEAETEKLIDYYISEGKIKSSEKDKLFSLVKEYSNNYRFSKEGEKIFNTDMVLYIVDEYINRRGIPEDPIDPNIRTDYGKLRFLVIENNRLNGNFNILREIIETGKTSSFLVDSFPIEEIIDEKKFISLLYYLGLLTIDGMTIGGNYIYRIPNLTIKALLWEYIRKALGEAYGLRIDTRFLEVEFEEMAFNGNWKKLFEYIFKEFYEVIKSPRDFIFKEEGVNMFLSTYLSLSRLYVLEREYSTSGGYVDIYLRKNWVINKLTKYEYLIELKHIKLEGKKEVLKSEIERVKKEGISQLKNYLKSLNRKIPSYAKEEEIPDIKKILIITSSKKLEFMEEISD